MSSYAESSDTDYQTALSYYRYRFYLDHDSSIDYQRIIEVVSARLLAARPTDVSFNLVVRWSEPGNPLTNSTAAGLGDLSHACKVVKLVQGHFPNVRVFLTNIFTEVNEYSYRISLLEALPLRKFDTKERNELMLGVQCPKALPEYLRTHYYGVQTIMLDVATPSTDVYPFNKDDLGNNHNGLNLLGCYHVDEYNGQRSELYEFTNQPFQQWFTAGIGFYSTGSLCTGIHVNQTLEGMHLPYAELGFLSSKELADWFSIPSEKTPEFYFGYFSVLDNMYAPQFLQVINCYESQRSDNSDVDVFLLSPGRDTHTYITEVIDGFVHNSCFNEISYIYPLSYVSEQNQFVARRDAVIKRRLRVFLWTERLPHEDVLKMMQVTGKMILISGDQSLAEAISLKDRVIFYEMQDWKQDLKSEIVKLAGFHFGEASSVHKFQKLSYKGFDPDDTLLSASELTSYLLKDDFLRQHEELMDIFIKKYDVNKWLLGMLNRRLIEHSAPELFAKESEIVSALTAGRNTSAKRGFREITTTLNNWVEKPQKKCQRSIRSNNVRTIATRSMTKATETSPTTYQFRLKLIQKLERVFY